jgi:hypothetical protein
MKSYPWIVAGLMFAATSPGGNGPTVVRLKNGNYKLGGVISS